MECSGQRSWVSRGLEEPAKMRILAVESATAWLSVAVLDQGVVLACTEEEAQGAHAKRLLPVIDQVLASSGLTLRKLDGLAVSIGPGSFTGVRIGLATMLAYRAVTGLPLAAVPTLEAMVWTLRGASPLLCPVLSARAGEVYWACYQWLPEGGLKQVQEARVGPSLDLTPLRDQPVLVFGEGWLSHQDTLRPLLAQQGVQVIEPPTVPIRPSAVAVGLAGAERLYRGETAGLGLSPLYVQRAEAEIVWERQGLGTPLRKARRRRRRSAVG
jgi:tRNA threonylcarbamoyladenosine biosynthesis protein TsaB